MVMVRKNFITLPATKKFFIHASAQTETIAYNQRRTIFYLRLVELCKQFLRGLKQGQVAAYNSGIRALVDGSFPWIGLAKRRKLAKCIHRYVVTVKNMFFETGPLHATRALKLLPPPHQLRHMFQATDLPHICYNFQFLTLENMLNAMPQTFCPFISLLNMKLHAPRCKHQTAIAVTATNFRQIMQLSGANEIVQRRWSDLLHPIKGRLTYRNRPRRDMTDTSTDGRVRTHYYLFDSEKIYFIQLVNGDVTQVHTYHKRLAKRKYTGLREADEDCSSEPLYLDCHHVRHLAQTMLPQELSQATIMGGDFGSRAPVSIFSVVGGTMLAQQQDYTALAAELMRNDRHFQPRTGTISDDLNYRLPRASTLSCIRPATMTLAIEVQARLGVLYSRPREVAYNDCERAFCGAQTVHLARVALSSIVLLLRWHIPGKRAPCVFPAPALARIQRLLEKALPRNALLRAACKKTGLGVSLTSSQLRNRLMNVIHNHFAALQCHHDLNTDSTPEELVETLLDEDFPFDHVLPWAAAVHYSHKDINVVEALRRFIRQRGPFATDCLRRHQVPFTDDLRINFKQWAGFARYLFKTNQETQSYLEYYDFDATLNKTVRFVQNSSLKYSRDSGRALLELATKKLLAGRFGRVPRNNYTKKQHPLVCAARTCALVSFEDTTCFNTCDVGPWTR